MSNIKEYARNSTIPFKASGVWCEKFMKSESLSLQQTTKISQKLPSEFETRLNFSVMLLDYAKGISIL
jgi:hypothetical protein